MYPRNWTVEVFKIPRTGQPQLFEIVAKSQKLEPNPRNWTSKDFETLTTGQDEK